MSLKRILLASVASAALLAGIGVQGVAYASPIPVANSYSDLLDPVSDAHMRLVADDVRQERTKDVEVAQFFVPHHHHHHHHHYRDRAWYLANGYIWSGGAWIIRPRGHHHHHHYHHHYN